MPRKLQAPSKRAHLKARLDRLQASLILILPGVASKSEFSNRFKTWKVKFLEIWRRTATRYYMILLCSYRVSKQSSKMTCFWQEDDDDLVFDADELEGEEEAPINVEKSKEERYHDLHFCSAAGLRFLRGRRLQHAACSHQFQIPL